MSAVLAKPQVKDFLKTLAKGKEKGQEQRKEHDVNAHAVTAEGEPSKKPWEEDIPELSSPSYSPPTSFSYSFDSSSSSNPRRRRAGSSIKGLLFNFGVGVGMMFTVMSNIREVRRLTLLLKEAESLIKDLEDELEGQDELKSDLGTLNHGAMLEQRHIFVTNTFRKVKSATDSLCSMQMILPHEPAASSRIEHVPSKDMSKLERELEAELERMELSLGDGEDPKLQHKSTCSSECGEVGKLVRGELTILGLPHEIEADSQEDSSSSSHEELQGRSYAVSPRALAKRLHEVLEARQEEKISELEAELKSLNSKLQAKEEEVRWLKDKSRGIHAAGVSEAADFKVQQSSPSRSHQKLSGSLNREKDTPQLKNVRSPNPSPIAPHNAGNVFNDVSIFKRGMEDKSIAFITLGGEALEAYKEACDEFSKLSTSGSDRILIPESRLSDRLGKETCTQEGKVDSKHLGSSDGWEQVDLLSLAEDFYGGSDPVLLENMPSWSKTSYKERRGPRRKSRIKGHPEPEPFTNSRGIDSSDDATNDTSGSTPCSIKFMDVRTVADSQNDDKQGSTEEGDCDRSREFFIRAGVNTPNQEDYESIYPEVEKNSGKFFPSSREGDWNFSDDSGHYSELDEQLGQLLIKRIIEKSRRGSPIVQDAQTVLAHLEKNEPVHTSE
ncbi:hypothetical protein L7F22_048562 [Adiantum nelumboides]|nr:hypothetical protein [Adiantum nelumboides]